MKFSLKAKKYLKNYQKNIQNKVMSEIKINFDNLDEYFKTNNDGLLAGCSGETLEILTEIKDELNTVREKTPKAN